MSAEGGSTDSGDRAAAVFTIAPLPTGLLTEFLIGAVLLLAGMMFLRWAQSWQ